MRDIGSRIRRYRLSRYAPPKNPLRRRLRWVLWAVAAWLLWAGLLSGHSLLRLWRLNREDAAARRELLRVRGEAARLDTELRDPSARRERAERVLREESGMAKRGEIVYRIRPAPSDSLLRK